MKKVVTNTKTVVVALVGIIGGCIWAYKSNWEVEPIILLSVSLVEVIVFTLIKALEEKESHIQPIAYSIMDNEYPRIDKPAPIANQTQNVNVNVNVPSSKVEPVIEPTAHPQNLSIKDRDSIVEIMKPKTKVLFIDDDKNFNVVKILKASGWKNTKSFTDIKNIEALKDYHIFFVDINGVGKAMGLENEGLDLALMLKQRFPEKKVIIYSANRNSNSFHEAWEKCDYKLEKNALPYQFTNLVEEISVANYKRES